MPFAVDVVLCPTFVYLVKNGKDAAEEVFASFENADTEDDAQANVAKLKSTDAVMNKREFVSVVVRHVHARGLWLAAAAGWGGRWHAGVVLAIRGVVVSTAFVLTLVVVHPDVSVHAWALASALANPRGLPRLVVDPACLSPDPRRRQFFVTTLHEILDKAGDGKVDANMRGLVANANKATKTNFMALNTADGTGSGAQSARITKGAGRLLIACTWPRVSAGHVHTPACACAIRGVGYAHTSAARVHATCDVG